MAFGQAGLSGSPSIPVMGRVGIMVLLPAVLGCGQLLREPAALPEPDARAAAEDRSGPSDFERSVLSLLSSGDQLQAEALVAAEIERFPNLAKYMDLLAAGKTKEAKAFRNDHADELYRAQRALFLHGALIRSRFNISGAESVFQTVFAIDSKTRAAQCALCVLRLDSLQQVQSSQAPVDKAFAELKKLGEGHPNDLMLPWMLAVECRHWDRNAEGAAVYELILSRWNPGPALVHQTYANLLDNLGRFEEALVERHKVVSMEPCSWSYTGLANTLTNLKRYDEAAKARAMAAQ